MDSRRPSFLALVGVLAVAFGMTACGGTNNLPPTPVLASLSISPSTAALNAGKTQQFSAAAVDTTGKPMTGVSVTWTSSDTTIVTVDGNGLATAKAAGTASVSASVGTISSNKATVTASDPVATIAVSPASGTVLAGQTQQFTATAKGATGNTLTGLTYTWTSSNPAVLKIDANGLATGITAGTATVTATSGAVTSNSATITGLDPVATIAIAPTSATVGVGLTQQFTATAKGATGNLLSGLTLTWASSNTAALTIDANGLATGKAVGTANITASASGVSSTVTSNTAAATVVVPTTVTGTAATGRPIAGVAVTLKDALGNTRQATTAADGSFSIDTTGLSAPFLLQIPLAAGGNLYSVSSTSNATATINLDPLTDMVIRSWYKAQGVAIDTAFASPTTNAPPAPAGVALLANLVQQVVQLWLQKAGVNVAQFDLIATPFVTNGTGVDLVLDQTTLNNTAGTVTITDGTTTQKSTLTYNATTGSINVATTTTSPAGTSSSSVSIVVPTQTAQQTALAAINAGLASFAATVNQKGALLADSDLIPYLAADLMSDGLNQSLFAANVAGFLRGVTVNSIGVLTVNSIDLTAGVADVYVQLAISKGSSSSVQGVQTQFKAVNGSWLWWGNRRIAEYSVQSEMRTNQGAYPINSGPDVNVDARPPQGTVSSVSITGGGFWNKTALVAGPTSIHTLQPTPTTTLTVKDDAFFINSGPLSAPVPAGTLFTLTLNLASGSPVVYNVVSNAITTDPAAFTGLTSTSISSVTFNQAMVYHWTLPTTYPIASVKLNAQTFTGNQSNPATFTCFVENPDLPAGTTSGSLTIPSTCNGLPVLQIDLNLGVTGVNGERSQAIYMLQ
ncbi:MAG: beta strand repeat-containing protein [Terriglobales bacterium]